MTLRNENQMSDKITIPAKLLKFAYSGFDFKYFEDNEEWEDAFTYYNNKPSVGELPVNSVESHFFDDCQVEVDAKEYEDACIDRIKEMLRCDFDAIFKHKHGVFVHSKAGPNVSIHCDPRPTTDEYEITI